MLITLDYLVKRYNLQINGVIHVGAHYGQEYGDYVKQGIKHMVFFEPLALAYAKLIETLGNNKNAVAFKLALGNKVGQVAMYVETANKGMSSSVLKPELHLKYSPTITFDKREMVEIDKLDNIRLNRSLYNMINIDVQGYELQVFKGATETLKNIDIIYAEVNFEELYHGCVHVEQLDSYLRKFGFVRVFTDTAHKSWGDALYLKYE